jgi:2-keto-4-pentenoate hydratase/2-oxohepta-3-ene-1,7-dioic acid hydratase in catechol pathway
VRHAEDHRARAAPLHRLAVDVEPEVERLRIGHLVSYVSRFMTLLPGDIIATGTPPGVGMGRKPPRYLAPGDVVTLGVAGLGQQRQRVRAHG